MSIDRKKVTKNAWRITRDRDKTCFRIRVPGGHLNSKYLTLVQELAEEFGNGSIHLTTRQGFEIPGIPYGKIPEVNSRIRPMIEDLGLSIETTDFGYPSAGTRNISACIGNRVCPIANDDTTSIARRIEKAVYPADFHFKIAVTGCPNDCIKAHMQDFGVICTTEPEYDVNRCISCEACVDNCKKKVTGALTVKEFDIVRDHETCIGCGECILKCPTRAWTRKDKKLFRLIIMGRTGKRNPRIAMPFLKWVTEDVVLQVIKNTYGFVDRHIDRTLPKEHIGYIVDRVGFPVFKKEVLDGVELNEEAKVAANISFGGYFYKSDNSLK